MKENSGTQRTTQFDQVKRFQAWINDKRDFTFDPGDYQEFIIEVNRVFMHELRRMQNYHPDFAFFHEAILGTPLADGRGTVLSLASFNQRLAYYVFLYSRCLPVQHYPVDYNLRAVDKIHRLWMLRHRSGHLRQLLFLADGSVPFSKDIEGWEYIDLRTIHHL